MTVTVSLVVVTDYDSVNVSVNVNMVVTVVTVPVPVPHLLSLSTEYPADCLGEFTPPADCLGESEGGFPVSVTAVLPTENPRSGRVE